MRVPSRLVASLVAALWTAGGACATGLDTAGKGAGGIADGGGPDGGGSGKAGAAGKSGAAGAAGAAGKAGAAGSGGAAGASGAGGASGGGAGGGPGTPDGAAGGGGGTCAPQEHKCGGLCVGNTPQTGCYGSASCDPCQPPPKGTATCTPAGSCDFTCDPPYNKSGTTCACPQACCSDQECGAGKCVNGACQNPTTCDPAAIIICTAACAIFKKTCNFITCACQ